MYLFINEHEDYVYDPLRKPTWQITPLKYGDWTDNGTLIKFIEFPATEVRARSRRWCVSLRMSRS